MSQGAEWISISEFARRTGCDRKIVQRAIQRGSLEQDSQGFLRASDLKKEWRKTQKAPATNRASKARKPATKSAPKIQSVAVSHPVVAGGQDAEAEPLEVDDKTDLEALLVGNGVSLIEAQRIKENALARQRLIEVRKASGELIEMSKAEALFFDIARSARNSWVSWPTRIAPLMAADLGVDTDKLLEVLSTYVHEQLTSLGEPEPFPDT